MSGFPPPALLPADGPADATSDSYSSTLIETNSLGIGLAGADPPADGFPPDWTPEKPKPWSEGLGLIRLLLA
jgi:hypothetical protein